MNIEGRYERCLSDIITLLQEAVYRFIAELDVDLTKFFLYFKQFHRNLVSLENTFHPNKTKFSRHLSKIHHLRQQIDSKLKQKTISLEPHNEKVFYKTGNHKSLKGESISNKLNTMEKTQELNVIGQIDQREDFQDITLNFKQNHTNRDSAPNRKRVGTAQGLRQRMSVTIDFQNPRPYTGTNKGQKRKNTQKTQRNNKVGNNRYRSLTKYEKRSVNNESSRNSFINQAFQNDNQRQINDQPETVLQHQHSLQPQTMMIESTQKKLFNLGKKKSIYEVLEEEKQFQRDLQIDDQFLKSGLIKLPSKRKSQQCTRLSFKINQLF